MHGIRERIEQVTYDGEGGGATIAATTTATTPVADDKLTISQAELEKLIEGRIAREKATWKKVVTPDPEVEALRAFKAEQERKEMERKGEYDKALKAQADSIAKEWEPKLTAEQERAKKLADKLRDNVVGLRISDAAGKLNAVNPEQVRRLLDSYIKLDDDHNPIVVDDAGNQRFIGANPMSPDQLVKEFLDGNPHFVRATSSGGGGAAGGRTFATGAAATEIQAAEQQVKQLEQEALRTGSPRALVAHEKAVKDLETLKAKGRAA